MSEVVHSVKSLNKKKRECLEELEAQTNCMMETLEMIHSTLDKLIELEEGRLANSKKKFKDDCEIIKSIVNLTTSIH